MNLEDFKNTCWNKDCLEILPLIPANSIDCIVCDLPYAVTANSWDVMLPMDKLWEQYLRIIKDKGAIVLFANEAFSSKLINFAQKYFRYKWYWIKNTGTNFFHSSRMPIRFVEKVISNKSLRYRPHVKL